MSALDVVVIWLACEYLLAGGAQPARPKTQQALGAGLALVFAVKLGGTLLATLDAS